MGDVVSYPIRPATSTQGGSNESDSRPDLGRANRVYDFYTWERVPMSGFPVKDGNDRLLVFVFSPIRGMWSEAANKKVMLAMLASLLEAAETVQWAGRHYRILKIKDAEVVKPGVTIPEHIGKLCVRLEVEEIEEQRRGN